MRELVIIGIISIINAIAVGWMGLCLVLLVILFSEASWVSNFGECVTREKRCNGISGKNGVTVFRNVVLPVFERCNGILEKWVCNVMVFRKK